MVECCEFHQPTGNTTLLPHITTPYPFPLSMPDPTNDVTLEHDLANALAFVAHMEARLSTLNTKITDITNVLVRHVRDLGGDTKAAEYGIYDGDDRIANMLCARIAELEEEEKV